ncbi:hypothetical protein HHI36_005879 [Cryptolaemus montrouzieri]|uniref:Golgi integral membrane protein 4 n=1 Tax=Cryptolaemus montrouzieri TaxID=559131 RepID=A0ABD2NVX9_9CUCU
MTTSRIVRGTKIRIFVCFCALVVVVGLLACYNKALSQLDDNQKALEICHQQQENLSTQLQVISDYKLRLEKALRTEKAEHSKSNSSFDQVLKDEKSRNDKVSMEAKLRFDALQQRYNLLQTEYDDYKEKESKTQHEQLDEINDLQTSLKALKQEKKVVETSKEKLKTEYLNLQVENDKLRKQLEGYELNSAGSENKTNFLQKQNIDLRREIDQLKNKCPEQRDTIQAPVILDEPSKVGNQEIKVKDDGQQADQNVLVMPIPNNEASGTKSSSTASSAKQSSQGSLNGARPLALPTMTPKNTKNVNGDVLANPNVNKVPEAVLPIPNKVPEGVVAANKNIEPNENPQDIIDNRYKNQIEEVKERKHEELEKENVANEVFEPPNQGDEGLGFGDPIKQAEKQNFNKEHIDNLAVYKEGGARNEGIAGGDYKEGPHDQLEENAGMDEGEDGKFREEQKQFL